MVGGLCETVFFYTPFGRGRAERNSFVRAGLSGPSQAAVERHGPTSARLARLRLRALGNARRLGRTSDGRFVVFLAPEERYDQIPRFLALLIDSDRFFGPSDRLGWLGRGTGPRLAIQRA